MALSRTLRGRCVLAGGNSSTARRFAPSARAKKWRAIRGLSRCRDGHDYLVIRAASVTSVTRHTDY
jgi:hypothetical protein